MKRFNHKGGFQAFTAVFCMVFLTTSAVFAADAPKQEEPAYQTAMKDAVAQFLVILENLKKQSLTPTQWTQKLQEVTQAVRWGPELQYSFITTTDQMVVLAAVDQSLIGKDMLNFTDSNGKKPFLEAKSKPGGGFVTLNWPAPGGQLPVPSTMLMRPIKFSPVFPVMTIVDNGFLAYTTDIPTTLVYRQLPFQPQPIPRGSNVQ